MICFCHKGDRVLGEPVGPRMEECRGSKAFCEAFEAEAAGINAGLWKSLHKSGMKQPWSFEAVSDLGPGETAQMLQDILQRAPTLEEVESFYDIMTTAKTYSVKHRRMVIAALDKPELRAPKRVNTALIERHSLMVRLEPRLLLAADQYPAANKRTKTTKEATRIKLVDRLCRIIVLCDFPAAQLIVGSIAPERLLQRFGAGRRISTLRQKLQSFAQLHKWCQAALGKNFPEKPGELVDFLLERADEPCGPSIPGSVLGMVAFFEEIGGQPINVRLANNSTVKAIVDELKLELSSAKPKAKRKANQLLIGLVLSMEAEVCDGSRSTYFRLLAWTRLLRIWACLRSSDTAGIPAHSLRMEGPDLVGNIEESKTTGRGKSVTTLTFYVAGAAWLCCETWLREGWELFTQGDRRRSFLLPLPNADYDNISDKEPSFIQNCTSFRKLLSEAKNIVQGDGGVHGCVKAIPGDDTLLAVGCQNFWAEHSDRATLSSWAAAMNFAKSRRDFGPLEARRV